MTKIVAIGEPEQLCGFAFAGVHVLEARDPEAARAAWSGLGTGVGLVILTRSARAAVAADAREVAGEPLWVVMP